jgi:hypothetical protein
LIARQFCPRFEHRLIERQPAQALVHRSLDGSALPRPQAPKPFRCTPDNVP